MVGHGSLVLVGSSWANAIAELGALLSFIVVAPPGRLVADCWSGEYQSLAKWEAVEP